MAFDIKSLWGGKRLFGGRKDNNLISRPIALPDYIWEKLSPTKLQQYIIDHYSEITDSIGQIDLAKHYASHDIILTPSQKRAYDAMFSKDDIFISGGAGVGKSELIKHFVRNFNGSVLVCAPTGVAAHNISGSTLHTLFDLEVKNDVYTEKDISEIRSRAFAWTKESADKKMEVLYHADCIIIDEISMCRGDTFAMIMSCISGIRDNKKELKLIVVGDFYQLPPVLTTTRDFIMEKSDGDRYSNPLLKLSMKYLYY